MTIKRLTASIIILLITIVLCSPSLDSQGQGLIPVAKPPQSSTGATCQDILKHAMNMIQHSCDGLTRNKACYGNNRIKVEPIEGAVLKFDAAGDRAAIQDIRTLVTSPLDINDGTWGLSVLKIQANLPDTLPGENVMFLVFGDTSVENVSGDMHAFYFTSGLGKLDCKEAPQDGILVRSPNHTEVTFTANGVQISIASTVVLRAQRNKAMSVQLVEGHARLTTPAGSLTLKPGEISNVSLGGDNGLTAVSAPSLPATANPDDGLGPMMTTTQDLNDADAPVSIMLDGCISETKGNFVVIDDYSINVGNEAVLKAAKVGDCVHIEGELKTDEGNGAPFVLVKGAKPSRPEQAGGNGNSGNNGNHGNGNKGSIGANNPGQGNGNGNNKPGGNGKP